MTTEPDDEVRAALARIESHLQVNNHLLQVVALSALGGSGGAGGVAGDRGAGGGGGGSAGGGGGAGGIVLNISLVPIRPEVVEWLEKHGEGEIAADLVSQDIERVQRGWGRVRELVVSQALAIPPPILAAVITTLAHLPH